MYQLLRRREIHKRHRQPSVESLELRRLLSVTPGTNLTTGTELTTYRFALAATAELTYFLGGVSATSAALDQIVEDVNLVFRQELAIELELVPNNDSVIFTNAASDGYTNGAPNTMATQNPTVLNGALGTGTYDIGHVLGTTGSGASGLAFLPTLGVSPTARGATVISSLGLAAPVMLHEIGHMLGARHTFNGTNGFCTASERDGDTAYEPGSGSTIMSYQGICGSDDLPVEPGDATYFHAANFEQILDYLNSIPTVGTSTSTSNSVPTIDAGADYTIPASTPFEITATGSDVDSQDVLTYTWEQIDSDPAGSGTPVPISSSADDVGPLFRSYAPTTDPTRVFPRLEDILNNTPQVSNVNEHLPTQSRTMNFRATVRDNHEATISGQTKTVSGVNSDDMIVTVVDTGNPFQVTNPNSAVTWTGGASETVTWNVAGTDANGINASNVQILLSTDGGNSFPYLLATTSNDGSHSLTVPNVDTSSARLKIKGDGNLFFDLSNEDFSINSNASLPGVTIVESAGSTTVSESGTAATDTYTVSLNTVPSSGAVDVLIAADAESLVSTDGVTFATSQTISFTSTSPQTVTVKAVNDSNDDGPGTSLLSHAISSSSSSEYPTTALINQVVATVIDDEIPPVVGVDYDCCGSTSTPTDWTQLTFLNASTSNLTFDNGIASSIDFSAAINGGGSLGVSTGTPLSGTIPQHIPLLSGLDGSSNFQSGITYTFSSLAPGVDYSVFVFGLDVASSGNYSQTVSISGATTLPTFNQTLPKNELWVNGQVGDSAAKLVSFGESVAANASGQITISVSPNAGSDGISLGGIALAETPIVPSVVPPTITSDGGGATASITLDENTKRVTDVNATDDVDSEGSGLTYSFTTNGGGGADNSLFTLSAAKGRLVFTVPPDFESPQDQGFDNTYEVQVTATDSEGATDTQDITIVITDMNAGHADFLGTNKADTIDVTETADGFDITLNGQTSTIQFADISSLTVRAGGGNDVVRRLGGTTFTVTIKGGNGADRLDGNAAVDILFGDAGADLIRGRSGNDILVGGDGNDTILGGNGSDNITGSRGDDRLFGENGNDILRGKEDNDILVGGIGNDDLSGDSGADVLIGGPGSDSMDGGSGADLLLGGSTSIDDDAALVSLIMAEWSSSNTYIERVNNLRDGSGTPGGGVNGMLYLPGIYTNDTQNDDVTGGGSRDYFWALQAEILDQAANEINDI